MGLGIGQSRPSQSQEGLTEEQKLAKQSSSQQDAGLIANGLNNDYLPEDIPIWDLAKAEEIIGGEKSNAFIILGRDRVGSKAGGHGGKGSSGAGSIHLIAGLNKNLKGNPNFITDAACIHISQLTDIDKNFGLAEGVVGSPKGRSGIGIKADGIRLVANEGIKIVTLGRGSDNSFNNKVETTTGIDLIAGNYTDDLEPMVKGLQVIKALNKIVNSLNDLSGIVNQFISAQTTFNTGVMTHTHVCAPIPLVAMPDPLLVVGGATNLIRSVVQCVAPTYLFNLSNTLGKVESLEPFGSEYICSRYNNVN
jgi:hypothetical protein|tara:strand:+ start:3419 stop:4339 length:921 start_codon:yes stop_codon:yes gene_type:complete